MGAFEDAVVRLWRYAKYVVTQLGLLLLAFLVAGLLIDALRTLPLIDGGVFDDPLRILADALITAIPVGSMVAFIIDRNLSFLGSCAELGLKGIYRNKRDEMAIRVASKVIDRARESLLARRQFTLRIAAINGNQFLHPHPSGELRKKLEGLLLEMSSSEFAHDCRIKLLLLDPLSANALARAESEEWTGNRYRLSSARIDSTAWNCRLFADAAASFIELGRLAAQYPRTFEVRYSDQMPIFVMGLNDEALVGVHNMCAGKSPSGTWHGRMPVYHHEGRDLELTSEAFSSFEYSWGKAISYEEFEESLAEARRSGRPSVPAMPSIPTTILDSFETNPTRAPSAAPVHHA